jgi:signal transduction histidine kinase
MGKCFLISPAVQPRKVPASGFLGPDGAAPTILLVSPARRAKLVNAPLYFRITTALLASRSMKILIVEDQADIRDTLRDILEINGHEVIAAEDGLDGVKRAAEKPEFIFCDMSMPNLDGRGVLAAVKQMPEVKEVPFIFLTAHADRRDQREGMSLGADDYITKPFTERDIIDAITARTHRQQTARERIRELSDHHRREISAHWSHELLTPLNAVIGSLELLEVDLDTMSSAEVKEMLGLIRQGATRQERLSRKLIRYFNLEQMKHATPLAAAGHCEAAPVINGAAAQAAREQDRGATLAVSSAPGDVALHPELLRDAIYEVVTNAMTFSPTGSPVTVISVARDGRYRIEVADVGSGMTPDQRARVGAFTQFDRQKREQQGLGLGLAIAQATAKLAGGALVLEDGPAGRGLRVVFDLPLAKT